MNRDKDFRIRQNERHAKREEIINLLKEKKQDCNKPKKGKDKE